MKEEKQEEKPKSSESKAEESQVKKEETPVIVERDFPFEFELVTRPEVRKIFYVVLITRSCHDLNFPLNLMLKLLAMEQMLNKSQKQ
jgi:hypothetical protein